MTRLISGALGIAVFAAVACLSVSAQQNQMSFLHHRAPALATGPISVDSPARTGSVKHSPRPPARETARGARI
jgi:hypothetical protein